MSKKVIIIGSGIAGISSSLKLKSYGFNSTIVDKGNFIGDLRSACYSPHFKKVIGIAMINDPYCKPSTTGLLEIEGNSLAVKVCDLPFI